MDRTAIREYIARNWYKLALALLLLFIILKKDLSLQLRLRAPVVEPTEQPRRPPGGEEPSAPAEERLSERSPSGDETEAQIELFDFSGIDQAAGRSPALGRVAERYCSKSEFKVKSLTPTRSI